MLCRLHMLQIIYCAIYIVHTNLSRINICHLKTIMVDKLKEVIDHNGCLECYLACMNRDNVDEDKTVMPSINDTALIQKGVSYWDSESLSETNSDSEDPVHNYDNLFDFGDDKADDLDKHATNSVTVDDCGCSLHLILILIKNMRICMSRPMNGLIAPSFIHF